MKKTIFYVIALLFAAIVVAVMPIEGEEGIYDSVIRLHVIAASDGEDDQALKLSVRDAILETYASDLGRAGHIGEAESEVLALCGDMEKTAQDVIRAAGYAYDVKVIYGEESYPRREYDAYTFPAGRYRSLRVVIGEGEGKNWWCVLYPPLCLGMATGTAPEDDSIAVGLSPGEYEVITGGDKGGYRLKFKALELLEGIFSRREK